MPEGPTQRPRAPVATVREGRELEAEAMPRGAVRICFDGSWTPVLRVELVVRLPTGDFMGLILQFNREQFTSVPARHADFSLTEAAIRAHDPKDQGVQPIRAKEKAHTREALRSFRGKACLTQVCISEMKGINALNLEPGSKCKWPLERANGRRSQGMPSWGLTQSLDLKPRNVPRAKPPPDSAGEKGQSWERSLQLLGERKSAGSVADV